MKTLLRIAQLHQQEWYDVLPMPEIAMNAAPIPPTEYSPFFLKYGFEPVLVPDVFSAEQAANSRTESIKEFTDRLKSQWKVTKKLLKELKEEHVRQQ